MIWTVAAVSVAAKAAERKFGHGQWRPTHATGGVCAFAWSFWSRSGVAPTSTTARALWLLPSVALVAAIAAATPSHGTEAMLLWRAMAETAVTAASAAPVSVVATAAEPLVDSGVLPSVAVCSDQLAVSPLAKPAAAVV